VEVVKFATNRQDVQFDPTMFGPGIWIGPVHIKRHFS